jgi:hypothetical protein
VNGRWIGTILFSLAVLSSARGAEISSDAIHAAVQSGECPTPLKRISDPDLTGMCGKSDNQPLLKYNLCLNRFFALNNDIQKYNAIVDKCSGEAQSHSSPKNSPLPTISSAAPSNEPPRATTPLKLIEQRLESGKCENDLKEVDPVTPDTLYCPTAEDSPAEAIICQNTLRQTNETVGRYNAWVQQCTKALNRSNDDLKARLDKTLDENKNSKTFDEETAVARQQSIDALRALEAGARKSLADAEAKKEAAKQAQARKEAAAAAARKRAKSQRQQAPQTYSQPAPAPAPVGESCRMYPWYMQCLGESPMSYCIETIHYDRPNCVP